MLLKFISDGKNALVSIDGKTLCASDYISIKYKENHYGSPQLSYRIYVDDDAIENEQQNGAIIRVTDDGRYYYQEGLDFDYLAAQMEVTEQMKNDGLSPTTCEDYASVFVSKLQSLLEERSRWPRQVSIDE